MATVKETYRDPVLDVIDERIAALEKKLERAQPLVDELNRLRQTRRTLLNEKSATSGPGHSGPRLTMEEVVHFLQENGPSSAQDISTALGFPSHTVRSHLSRGKGTRYANVDNGTWALTEEA